MVIPGWKVLRKSNRNLQNFSVHEGERQSLFSWRSEVLVHYSESEIPEISNNPIQKTSKKSLEKLAVN